MKLILVVLFVLYSVAARSVTDSTPIPLSLVDIAGPCATVRCMGGMTCRLLAKPDCKQNCELVPQCVTDSNNGTNGCGPNAQREACGTACEPTCDSQNVTICTANCVVNVCRCNPGFVRNAVGSCVEPSQCFEVPRLTCATVDCMPGYRCEQVMINCFVPPCPQPPPKCVLINGSTPAPANRSCPANENWNQCGNACERTCATRNNVACPMICMTHGACTCNAGFVRENGVCVSETTCPLVDNGTCSKNETHMTCGTACEPSCSSPRPSFCTEQCVVGCQCNKGFLRNATGACVLTADCSADSGTTCANVRCDFDTECKMVKPLFCASTACATRPQCVPHGFSASTTAPVKCNLQCKSGQVCQLQEVLCIKAPCNPIPRCVDEVLDGGCALVDCQSGFRCVEETNPCFVDPCPKTAKCVPMANTTCDTVKIRCGVNYACGIVDGAPRCVYNGPSSCAATLCMAGTSCIEEPLNCSTPPCGTKATCVAGSNSGSTCAATECAVGFECVEETHPCFVASCTTEAKCVRSNSTGGATCENVRLKCDAGEKCGMINGAPTCVKACAANETFTECSSLCEEVCGQELTMACPASCGPAKCQCNFGYMRNFSGVCVLPADCNKKDYTLTCATVKCGFGTTCIMQNGGPTCSNQTLQCGENELEDKCGGCEKTCSDQNPICTEMCRKPKCVCANGFVRNDQRECVSFDMCEDSSEGGRDCASNEVHTDCMPQCENTCRGDKCSASGNMTIALCTPGCICKPFYKRDENGFCRHNRQCFAHAGCGNNEKWDKCRPCEKTCENPSVTKCSKKCSPGCSCKDGFVRNAYGECVDETTGCK